MMNIKILKSINSTIKEKVKIKQHTRVEGGKVSNVKQHMALREVNPDKEFLSMNEFAIAAGNTDYDTITGKELTNIYRRGIHTIHDQGLEKNDWELNRVYERFSDAVSNPNMMDYIKPLFNQESAKKMMSDSLYLHGVSNIVDLIENKFKFKFGVNTERVSPFTFRFKHECLAPYITNMEQLNKSIVNILNKSSNNPINDLPLGTKHLLRMKFRNIDMNINEKNKNMKNLLQETHDYLFDNLADFNLPDLIDKYNLKYLNFSNYADLIRNEKITNLIDDRGDGEILRKEIKKALNNSKKAENDPDLNKILKQLKPQQVVPQIAFIKKQGCVPTNEMMNNLYDPIKKIVDSINSKSSQVDKGNGINDYMYVTKNPLELITMSPAGNFESCQSVSYKDSFPSISSFNGNLVSAMYGSHNNDFIMFIAKKTSKGLEKAARISYTYNEKDDVFSSQEHNRIYGSLESEIGKMRTFVDKNDEHFINGSGNNDAYKINDRMFDYLDSEAPFDVVNEQFEPIEKISDKIYNNRENKSILKECDNELDEIQDKYTKKFKNDSHNINMYAMAKLDELLNLQKRKMLDEISSGKQSMIYSSPFHKYIQNLYDIDTLRLISKIRVAIRKVPDNIKRMKRMISSSVPPKVYDSMVMDSGIKEKVKIKQHTRIENGKVSNVKEYMALREVNQDKGFFNSELEKEYNGLIDKAKKGDADVHDVINIYKRGKENGIYDKGMERNDNNYDVMYNHLPSAMSNFSSESVIGKAFEDMFGQDAVKNKFTDIEYIKRLSNRVDTIEKVFNEDLNINTERIDPFTFKFESEYKNKQKIDDKWLLKVISKLAYDIAPDDPNSAISISKRIHGYIHDTVCKLDIAVNSKNFDSKIWEQQNIPIEALNGISYEEKFLEKLNLKKLDGKILDYMESIQRTLHRKFANNIKDFKGYGYVDGEILRKELKKEFSENEDIKNIPEIMNTLKKLKPQQVKPQLQQFKFSDYMLTPEVMDKLYKPISEFSTKQINEINKFRKLPQVSKQTLYVSKNPFEFLTMSPSGNFESCQSLCEYDGISSISNNNINMINAAYGDGNNDFILFTLKKENSIFYNEPIYEKGARTSLSYNNNMKKFNTFEDSKIYTGDRMHHDIIRSFMNKNSIHIQNAGRDKEISAEIKDSLKNFIENSYFNNIAKHLIFTSKEARKCIENDDKYGFDEHIKKISDMYNMFSNRFDARSKLRDKIVGDDVANEQKKQINDVFKNKDESMLYGSNGHSLFQNGGGFDDSVNTFVDKKADEINESASNFIEGLRSMQNKRKKEK